MVKEIDRIKDRSKIDLHTINQEKENMEEYYRRRVHLSSLAIDRIQLKEKNMVKDIDKINERHRLDIAKLNKEKLDMEEYYRRNVHVTSLIINYMSINHPHFIWFMSLFIVWLIWMSK